MTKHTQRLIGARRRGWEQKIGKIVGLAPKNWDAMAALQVPAARGHKKGRFHRNGGPSL